jgi:aldehyde dehydrogenase (NAD+)
VPGARRRFAQPDALRRNKEALVSLVSLEMGKIKAEGDGEVQEMIDIGDFALGQSRMLYGLTMHSERARHRMYEQWHPLGIVGVVSSFNFPVAVWAWNAFISAVCGNVTVWKPSSKCPLCCIAVQKICNEALEAGGFPPIFLSFMASGHDLANRFVEDDRVKLLSFTGSTWVGRSVAKRVAERFGRSILELGGNNAIIVDETSDLQLAPAIVFGCRDRRAAVHTTRRFRARIQAGPGLGAGRRLPICGKSDPLEPNTLMGRWWTTRPCVTSRQPSRRHARRAARCWSAAGASTARATLSNRRSSRPATNGRSSRPKRSCRYST